MKRERKDVPPIVDVDAFLGLEESSADGPHVVSLKGDASLVRKLKGAGRAQEESSQRRPATQQQR